MLSSGSERNAVAMCISANLVGSTLDQKGMRGIVFYPRNPPFAHQARDYVAVKKLLLADALADLRQLPNGSLLHRLQDQLPCPCRLAHETDVTLNLSG